MVTPRNLPLLWYDRPSSTSLPPGPEMGAGSGRGCAAARSQCAARVGNVAHIRAAATPAGWLPSPTALEVTGALEIRWTHQTVGELYIRVRAGLRKTQASPTVQPLAAGGSEWRLAHAKTCQGCTLRRGIGHRRGKPLDIPSGASDGEVTEVLAMIRYRLGRVLVRRGLESPIRAQPAE